METLGDVEAERQAEVAKATQPLERDVRAIVLTEIEVFAQHLGQRPVRDAVTVRETAAGPLQRLRLLLREPSPQLTHEPSLPNTRVADDRDELGPPFRHRLLVRVAKALELGVATDEDCAEPADAARPHQREGMDEALRDDAILLPFRLHRHGLAQLERTANGSCCPLAHEDLVRAGGLLEPRPDIHSVTGDERGALPRPAAA